MFYLIALIVVGIDQLTKLLIVKNMTIGEDITIIDNFLYITSIRNSGAAWGILEDRMWFFYLITIVFIGAIIWFVRQYGTHDLLFTIAMGLVLGGAIGNFIDRVFRKEVVDFIHTYIFSYNFPVFNIADSALFIGVALMFLQTFLEGRRERGK